LPIYPTVIGAIDDGGSGLVEFTAGQLRAGQRGQPAGQSGGGGFFVLEGVTRSVVEVNRVHEVSADSVLDVPNGDGGGHRRNPIHVLEKAMGFSPVRRTEVVGRVECSALA